MKPQKRIIVHVDNRHRDLMACVWLKNRLEELGATVRLTSRVTLTREFERFRPHACLLSHTFSFANRDQAAFVNYAQRTRIFIVPTEDAIIDTPFHAPRVHEVDLPLVQASPEKGWLHYVTRVYAWGPAIKKELVNQGFARDEQVVVAGNPRYDIDWQKLAQESRLGKPIGIIGSFADINPWDFHTRPWSLLPHETRYKPYLIRKVLDGPQYLFDAIQEGRSQVTDIYAGSSTARNMEDSLWASFAHLRLIFDFLDRWTALGGKAILRPHPTERMKTYDLLLARYAPHLELSTEQGFFRFLKRVSGIIVMSSTSILESVLGQRPIIGLEKLLHGRYLDHVQGSTRRLEFLDHIWQAENMDMVVKMAQAATHGQLSTCPDPAYFANFFREKYNFPHTQSVTDIIAQDVMNFLHQDNFEPEFPSSLAQAWHEANYQAYVTVRKTRSFLKPEWKQYDDVYNQLGPSSSLEQEYLSYLRQEA